MDTYILFFVEGGGEYMTIYEANRRHNIPLEVLQEYEKWQLPGTENKCPGRWQYDELDLKNLSIITTLYDSGFSEEGAHEYMFLLRLTVMFRKA